MIGPPTSRFEIRPLNKPRMVRTIWVERAVEFHPSTTACGRDSDSDRKLVSTATPIRADRARTPSGSAKRVDLG